MKHPGEFHEQQLLRLSFLSRMRECSMHGVFSVSLFPNIPSAVELAKVPLLVSPTDVCILDEPLLYFYWKHLPSLKNNKLTMSFSDAMRQCDCAQIWCGQLPQGTSFSLYTFPNALGLHVTQNVLFKWPLNPETILIQMCALFPSVFQAPDLITAFDEHRVSPNFKFGVLYQRAGQVNNWNAGRSLEALNSSASLQYLSYFLCIFYSWQRRTYSVTMRKVKSFKNSSLFWELQLHFKGSLGNVQ